jgi:hypothetical protein
MVSEVDVVVEVRNEDFPWENVGIHVKQSEALVSSEGCNMVIITNIRVSGMAGKLE